MRAGLAIVLVAAVVAVVLLMRDEARDARGKRHRAGREAASAVREPGAESDTLVAEPGARPRATIHGILVDSEDRPISGGTIHQRVWTGEEHEERGGGATTDASGTFEIALHRTRWWTLRAYHPLYQVVDHPVDPDAEEPVRIVLFRGAPLAVVVTTPDGSPVPGVTVYGFARTSPEGVDWFYHVDLGKRITDRDGRARMGAVTGTASVSISHKGYAPAWKEVRTNGIDPTEVTLVLDRGGIVEGVVTSPTGTPVAGARVHVRRAQDNVAITDEYGRYRLKALPDWGVRIVAEADGFGPAYFGDALGWGRAVPVRVKSGEVEPGIDITLSLPTFLTGRIVDVDDQPIAGITVDATIPGAVSETTKSTTDRSGAFRVGPFALKRASKARMAFDSKKYSIPIGSGIDVKPGEDVDIGTRKAKLLSTVKGLVVQEDGSPLRKGRVTADHHIPVLIKPDGTFELPGILPGVEFALVALGERARSKPTSVTVAAGATLEGVVLRVHKTLTISGRVTDQNGVPRPHFEVMLAPPDTTGPYETSSTEVQTRDTDSDGRFRFETLLPGRYTVGPGGWENGQYRFLKKPPPVIVAAGAPDVLFTIPFSGGFVTGTVLSKRTGLPIREFDLYVYKMVLFIPVYKDGADVKEERGAFRMEVEEAGSWAVEVAAKGHAPFRTKPKAVKAGETIDFGAIRLGDAGSVAGRVTDHLGQPVRWAKIHLLSPKLETNFDAPLTDRHGRFSVTGLAPGAYTLFAVSPRHPLAMLRNVAITEGGRTTVKIELAASAPLTIRVVDEQQQPIAKAKLVWTFEAIKPLDSSMVSGREPPGYGSNIADVQGVIRKPFFPAGAVELKIGATGYRSVQRTVTLKPGEPKAIEIRLARSR